MEKWVEICRTGIWTAKGGNSVTLTKGDLDNIVKTYDPKDREAPLVFGHPEDTEPAYGWVANLKRSGEILLAKFKDVPEAVKKMVREKYYKKVSIALGADKKTLRHVGLLGAVQPAVSGLKDVEFGDGDAVMFLELSSKQEEGEMGDEVLKKELEAEKKAREAAEKKAEDEAQKAKDAAAELSKHKDETAEKEVEARVNALVGKKIKGADKDVVKRIAMSLAKEGEEIEFSQGAGKKPMVEHLFSFLDGLPDQGLTTEFSDPGPGGDPDGDEDLSGLMDRV